MNPRLNLPAMPSLGRFALAAGLVLGGPIWAGNPEAASQQTLKAAFICHFLVLTRWPAQGSPVVVGIYGTSKEGDDVAATLPASVGGLALKVVRLPLEVQDWGPVNAVYIPSAYQAEVPNLVRRIGAAPVLTIGDSPHFIEDGGVIGFIQEGNKLRFEINQGAAARKGLTLSAKLLELARSIKR